MSAYRDDLPPAVWPDIERGFCPQCTRALVARLGTDGLYVQHSLYCDTCGIWYVTHESTLLPEDPTRKLT